MMMVGGPLLAFMVKPDSNSMKTREELIDVGILIGTDFNPNGFDRIGPKTALKMIKQHSRLEDIPQIQEQLQEIKFQQIRKIFLEPEVTNVD